MSRERGRGNAFIPVVVGDFLVYIFTGADFKRKLGEPNAPDHTRVDWKDLGMVDVTEGVEEKAACWEALQREEKQSVTEPEGGREGRRR